VSVPCLITPMTWHICVAVVWGMSLSVHNIKHVISNNLLRSLENIPNLSTICHFIFISFVILSSTKHEPFNNCCCANYTKNSIYGYMIKLIYCLTSNEPYFSYIHGMNKLTNTIHFILKDGTVQRDVLISKWKMANSGKVRNIF
jgi:hypothetical protein